jgi:hypothetical protein
MLLFLMTTMTLGYVMATVVLTLVLVIIADILYKELSKKHANIPKIIWTYWDNPDLPPIVQLCTDSWKKYHPEFKVVVLTSKTVNLYLGFDIGNVAWLDSLSHKADVIRLHILEKYGGIWSDATILCGGRFPLVAKHFNSYNFMGYYLKKYTDDERYPVLEGYWFATVPRGDFVTKWRQAMMSFYPGENVMDRVDRFEKHQGVDTQALNRNKYYLLINVAAQYVFQKTMKVKDIKRTMLIVDAEADDGPFHFMKATEWKPEKSLLHILSGKNTSPIIKFTAAHRFVLDHVSALRK